MLVLPAHICLDDIYLTTNTIVITKGNLSHPRICWSSEIPTVCSIVGLSNLSGCFHGIQKILKITLTQMYPVFQISVCSRLYIPVLLGLLYFATVSVQRFLLTCIATIRWSVKVSVIH